MLRKDLVELFRNVADDEEIKVENENGDLYEIVDGGYRYEANCHVLVISVLEDE
jgi:hypothetical protein